MIEKLFNFLRIFLIKFGQQGTKQMCVGFLYEVEIPQELKEEVYEEEINNY